MIVTTLLTEEAALRQGLATQHHIQCRASLGLTDTPPALLARIRPSELPPTPKQPPSLNGNLLPGAPGFDSESKSLQCCIQKSLSRTLTIAHNLPEQSFHRLDSASSSTISGTFPIPGA